MKTNLIFCLVLSLAALVILVSPTSQAGLLLWDFEDVEQLSEWKAANGTWEIEDGVLKETSATEVAAHILVGDVTWDNYTVEAKVRLDKGNWAGLLFRAHNVHEYYVFYMNVPDNKTELWVHQKPAFDSRRTGNPQNFPAVKPVVIKNGEWIHMKVKVEKDKFTLFLNGKEQGTGSSGIKYNKGKIGVWCWETQASFDDFKVYGPEIRGTVVEPQNDKTITQKQRLEVKINMSTSELIHDFISNLIFNPQILKATSVDSGPFLTHNGADPTTCSTPVIDNAKGQITRITCRRNTEDGVTGTGILATINFEAIDVGGSTLIIENASFSNPKGEAIEFITRDGKVTVYGPHGKIMGKVTDSQDQPVYGVEMVVFLDDQPVGINGETDWSGNYLIDNIVQAGRVTVKAIKSGEIPIKPVEVDVRIGQATENVDFTVFEPTPLHSVVDAEGFIRNWLLLGPIPWENDTTRLMSDQLNPKTQAEDDCLEVAYHAIIQLLNQQHT